MINPILYFFERRYPSASGDAPQRQTCERRVRPFPNGYAVRETPALLQYLPYPPVRNSVYRVNRHVLPVISDWPLLRPLRCRTGQRGGVHAQVEYVRLFLSGKDDRAPNTTDCPDGKGQP